jgi:hypothetical protein
METPNALQLYEEPIQYGRMGGSEMTDLLKFADQGVNGGSRPIGYRPLKYSVFYLIDSA